MKKISFIFIMLIICNNIFSQSINGKITNETGEVLTGALIKIIGTQHVTDSKEDGTFSFHHIKKGKYSIQVSLIGYESVKKDIIISDNALSLIIPMKISEFIAEEVIITALRADLKTPIAFTNINKQDIEKNNTGKDIPYLLNMTPSVVVSSDAGAGIGYTSMRIRGTDMTRINVTLDGIPLNDSESHGVWWVNMPDFASSVNNIQIQRGVGTSTNGAAAFGANINFVTNTLEKEAYADVNYIYGSFNTQKATFKAGTGLLGNHFTFDARLSKIHSDGFIDRARTDLNSYYLSGTYVDKKNFVKVNVFSGTEDTYQAWNGVPKDSLETNRTYNSYTYENEVDHYTQKHHQLFYTRTFSKYFSSNLAFHYTKGEGFYEQFKEDEEFTEYGLEDVSVGTEIITNTDLIRRKWLDNDFIGVIYSYDYSRDFINIVLGGAYNKYYGDHFGRLIWAEYASNGDIRHEWYNNSGLKTELNEYLKVNYKPTRNLNLWLDFQYRKIDYNIKGVHDDLRDITQDHSYNFFNPKAGFSYNISNKQNTFFSFAVANREPSRSNFRDATEGEVFVPETLFDYEAGYKLVLNRLALNLNIYYMNYKDQLILTGEINDVGAYIMSNIPESFRAGVELFGAVKITDFLEWKFNATYSKNKIKNLTVYIDNWDTWEQEVETYTETDISFSPEIIAGSEISFNIFKGFELDVISKYVSKQYIDNTSSNERSLDPYFVNNLRLSYKIKTKRIDEIGFNIYINNLFNESYESNAWVYRYYYGNDHYVTDGYFPQAGINFLAGINLSFR